MRKGGELCVTAKVVASLTDDEGRPAAWPDTYRDLLLSAGPQPPELLTVAESA